MSWISEVLISNDIGGVGNVDIAEADPSINTPRSLLQLSDETHENERSLRVVEDARQM